MPKNILGSLCFVAASVLMAAAANPPSGLEKEKEITLEGGPSFDLVSVDSASQRLYIAHNPKIDVIDLKKGTKIGEVTGVDGAHAAIALPEIHRGFATSGPKSRLIVFDTESFKSVKEIETGQNPDGLLYVQTTKEVWCFNGRGKNVTCVDAATLDVKATIALEGQPEAAVENPEKGLVYVNLEDKSAVCVIDIKKHEALEVHSIAPGNAPTGIAFDAKNGLVFSGCANKMLVAVDVASWKVVGSVPIGDRCDGACFDPETGNVYASCNNQSGGLHVKDAKTFEPLPTLETPGGKTCALDPKSHKLFVVSGPKRGEKGPVKVLVFAPK